MGGHWLAAHVIPTSSPQAVTCDPYIVRSVGIYCIRMWAARFVLQSSGVEVGLGLVLILGTYV